MRIIIYGVTLLLLSFGSCIAMETPATGIVVALRGTMNYHPAIKGKLAELKAQGYRIASAKSARYPILSGSVNRQDDGEQYGSLLLRQPLWAFGKIDTPIALEKVREDIERLKLLQIQRQLIERTTIAFIGVQRGQQRLQVADENITEHQKLYQQIERRKVGQLASEADVRLAFSRTTQAELQRERIRGDLQIAVAELKSLTQIEIGYHKNVESDFVVLPGDATINSLAIKRHADIQIKKEQIEIVKYNVAMEKIVSTPTLYAEVTRDFFDSSTDDETRFGITFEGALDGAGLGIFNRIKSSKALVVAARQDLSSTKNDVALQISSLLTSLSLQGRLQKSLLSSADAVRKTRESFYRQYDSGRKTWMEVLNIQRELTELLLQLVQAKNDQLSLSLRIAALIGHLDKVAGIDSVTSND